MKGGALVGENGSWKAIDWKVARQQVTRLQMRLTKAMKKNRWNKVKAFAISVDTIASRQGIGCQSGDLEQAA